MILGDSSTYYVSSSTTSHCPQPCHPLSYYITDTATYFTSNATFIFMEGEHLLDSKGSVQVVINHIDNLTLRGERGHSNTDIIIRCSSNTHGLVFRYGNIVNIQGITITECGQQDISPLLFSSIVTLYIHEFIVHNNTYEKYNGGGLNIHSISYITITNSMFTNNKFAHDGAGLYMYIHVVSNTENIITITNSTISNNMGGITGGGLVIWTGTDVHAYITITNSAFTNNIANYYGGGFFITFGINTCNNIIITNSLFTNNRFKGLGGGLYIWPHNDTHITIINSKFTNNTIGEGGGLLVYSDNNVHATIINCTFTGNTVGHHGGGLYIQADSITITDSAFVDNTVGRHGGGLYMIITADNITITNSTFISNTADVGGGLCITSTNNTQNDGIASSTVYYKNIITITNSTLTNNKANKDGSGLYIVFFMIIHVTI